MKKLNYVLLGISFVSAIGASILNFNKGFDATIWPVIAAIWIVNSFINVKTIEKLEKL
jgi:hypothetical protein